VRRRKKWMMDLSGDALFSIAIEMLEVVGDHAFVDDVVVWFPCGLGVAFPLDRVVGLLLVFIVVVVDDAFYFVDVSSRVGALSPGAHQLHLYIYDVWL